MESPKTLQEAIIHFADLENCKAFMVSLRWPDGVVKCPRCQSEKVFWIEKERRPIMNDLFEMIEGSAPSRLRFHGIEDLKDGLQKLGHTRINLAFRLATARKPTAKERQVLRDLAEREVTGYHHDPDGAQRLLHVGESKFDSKLDAGELAAWTTVASVILNLDETITKQ